MLSCAMSFTREMMAAFSSLGGCSWLIEHAVHAVANAKLFLERLDVNVARSLFDGLRDHCVDETDDRSFARHVAKMLEIFGHLAVFAEELFCVAVLAPTRRNSDRRRR